MIQIKTSANSFQIGGLLCQKGKVVFNVVDDGIIYQNNRFKFDQVECDGSVMASQAELVTWLNENVFKNGGGSGGGAVNSVTGTLVTGSVGNPVVNNPLLEIHRVVVTNDVSRTITDFGGTITLVTNGLDPATAASFDWGGLEVDTRKLTIIFTFDCPTVTNTGINGVQLLRLPSSAINGDVWEVVYDKFYNIWNLVSVNNSASFEPTPDLESGSFLVGSTDGNIGRKILRGDLNINNGQALVAHPTTGVLSGVNFSLPPSANSIPVRTNQGNVQSNASILPNDAVIKSDLSGGTEKQVMGYNDTGVPIATTINIDHLTDIAGFPSFQNGVFTATAINSTDKTALLSFIEFSTTTPKAGTFATYSTGGVMKVGDAVDDGDAVNKAQLDAIIPNGGFLVLGNTAETAARGNHTHPFNQLSGIANIIQLPNIPASKITSLPGYVIGLGQVPNILPADSLTEAISKLEARILALESV